MGIKGFLKKFIADFVYSLYEHRILHENIHVCTIDETIDELLATTKSLVRFGDGEINLIRGRNNATQASALGLDKKLVDILATDNDNLMVTLPDIFEGMEQYRPSSKLFWKDHILMSRSTYHKYCDPKKKYYNTSFSRNYYAYADRSVCAAQNDKIKQIWADKDLIIVEGAATHNGVGNDLLDKAGSICRIIGPSTNAYSRYDDIYSACLEIAKKKDKTNLIFLVSLGAAAKPLVLDLFNEGYRVIDIGNLDLEYEWFLMQTDGKTTIAKHDCIGEKANREAGYTEYLSQIVKYI